MTTRTTTRRNPTGADACMMLAQALADQVAAALAEHGDECDCRSRCYHARGLAYRLNMFIESTFGGFLLSEDYRATPAWGQIAAALGEGTDPLAKAVDLAAALAATLDRFAEGHDCDDRCDEEGCTLAYEAECMTYPVEVFVAGTGRAPREQIVRRLAVAVAAGEKSRK